MLDATGRYRFRYEDVFRALGNYIDANHFKDVTILETDEGFLIKGQVVQEHAAGISAETRTYLFTNDDLDVVVEVVEIQAAELTKPPMTPSEVLDGLEEIGLTASVPVLRSALS